MPPPCFLGGEASERVTRWANERKATQHGDLAAPEPRTAALGHHRQEGRGSPAHTPPSRPSRCIPGSEDCHGGNTG